MDILISQLNRKYDVFIDSLKDRKVNNFIIFYKAIYDYFETVEKQLELKNIIQVEKQEVDDKKKEAITKHANKRNQKAVIHTINRTTPLSFFYYRLHDEIFIPMKTSFSSLETFYNQPILGTVLISDEPYEGTSFYFLAGVLCLIFGIKKGRDFAFLRIKYQFRKREYVEAMKKFHSVLTDRIMEMMIKESREVKPKVVEKIKLIINSRKGIYQEGNDKAYAVGKTSKRFKLIKYLRTKDCLISELTDFLHQDSHTVMRSISEINRLFREKTLLSHDLICHNDTVGYFLNQDVFEISVIE